MENRFFLGIISGMGAKVLPIFCKKIIDNNHVNREQDHIPFVAMSDPMIEDRTSAILNGNISKVTIKLQDIINKLSYCNITHLIMLCNTAHYWLPYLDFANIQIIDIIQVTKEYIDKKNLKNTMLLATRGTYYTKIYTKYFNDNLLYPNDEDITIIMKMIYACKLGKNDPTCLINLLKKIKQNMKIDSVILGCTELSILLENIPFIDDVEIIDPLCVVGEYIIDNYKV